jgi:hypothetical protein
MPYGGPVVAGNQRDSLKELLRTVIWHRPPGRANEFTNHSGRHQATSTKVIATAEKVESPASANAIVIDGRELIRHGQLRHFHRRLVAAMSMRFGPICGHRHVSRQGKKGRITYYELYHIRDENAGKAGRL